MNALRRSRRLIWLWAGAAAITAFLLIISESDASVSNALFNPNVWMAGLCGLAVSIAYCPLLSAHWVRWYWGIILGLPVGATTLFVFFFFNPHSWQGSRINAWKSVLLFLGVYPHFIVPGCIGAGILGSLLINENEPTSS
jgi:hypothetical protein